MESTPSTFQKYLPLLNILLGIVCVALVVMAFIGHGNVTFNFPADTTVKLNGKPVSLKTEIPIRAGNYTFSVSNPRYSSEPVRVSIKPFENKTITAQSLVKRDPQDILTSVHPSNGSYGPAQIVDTMWLHNNTWLVGLVGPGTTQPIALHYDKGSWQEAYYAYNGPEDKSTLPADIADYLTAKEAPHEH